MKMVRRLATRRRCVAETRGRTAWDEPTARPGNGPAGAPTASPGPGVAHDGRGPAQLLLLRRASASCAQLDDPDARAGPCRQVSRRAGVMLVPARVGSAFSVGPPCPAGPHRHGDRGLDPRPEARTGNGGSVTCVAAATNARHRHRPGRLCPASVPPEPHCKSSAERSLSPSRAWPDRSLAPHSQTHPCRQASGARHRSKSSHQLCRSLGSRRSFAVFRRAHRPRPGPRTRQYHQAVARGILHAFRVQSSHVRAFSDSRNVRKRATKSDTIDCISSISVCDLVLSVSPPGPVPDK